MDQARTRTISFSQATTQEPRTDRGPDRRVAAAGTHRCRTLCRSRRGIAEEAMEWRPIVTLQRKLGVLALGLLQDRDIGIRIFPERKKILITSLRFCAIASQGICATQAKMCQRADQVVLDHAWMIENLLKLDPCRGALFSRQIGLAPKIG